MKYLDSNSINQIGINWPNTIVIIEHAINALRQKEFSQPIKPYLRFNNPKNRIIAMPAYVGGNVRTAGIKWIASFPDNINNNMPRAHSVVILNDENTGTPYLIANTSLLSAIRTASVTGYVLNKYVTCINHENKFNVGIIGFGQIGQTHFDLVCKLLGSSIGEIYLYDNREISEAAIDKSTANVKIVHRWQDVFDNVSILITCTVANERYISRPGRKGSLHLNVSLRDYCAEFMQSCDLVLVDNWEEVCRENTDVHFMHTNYNLQKKDVLEIDNELFEDCFDALDKKVVMFNPMGMAVFDIAIAKYYYDLSNKLDVGIFLPD